MEDYFAPGGDQWRITLNFQDFAEPYREVKLKLSIEGGNILMQTKPDFNDPNGVFTIYPGQPYTLDGSLLEPYFNSSSMNITGITWSQLMQNGRLPEEFYTFCVQVVDVYSGEILSAEQCGSAWLRLNDQPITNTPYCGQVINTTVPLNIQFQWQANNLLSTNPVSSTEYQLNVFEVTNNNISPLNAVSNGDAILVFQSQWNNQPSYLYNLSAPALDVGKCYAYTVQARDVSGRDLFKNNGFSEVCWFYYGYPEGGLVPLLEPADSAGFSKFQRQYFRWDGSANFLPNQPINYEWIVVEVDSTQTSANAIANNQPWHQEMMPVYYGGTGYDFELNKQQKTFEKGQRYAWQVYAHSGSQIVAESPVYTFMGPPIVEEFYVNNHKVEVVSLATQDLNDLSGEGRVALDAVGQTWANVSFDHISLVDYGGIQFLSQGTLWGEVESLDSLEIALTPNLSENGVAIGRFKEVRLSNDQDLDVKLVADWIIPLLLDEPSQVHQYTQPTWCDYTSFELTGELTFLTSESYAMLEPYRFRFGLNNTSTVQISANSYELKLDGIVEVPSVVRGYDANQRVAYQFQDQPQPFYLTGQSSYYRSNIVPLGEMNIRVEPEHYYIDLSDTQSPGKFQNDVMWKGVYLQEFRLKFQPTAGFSSLQFSGEIDELIQLTDGDSIRAWITAEGFNFFVKEDFNANQSITYNTFPGQLDHARIEVYNNAVTNSYLKGNIKVPFFSATDDFGFTVPMTVYGYSQGYLDEAIDSLTYVFNQGAGENEVLLHINRAVFKDNQKLLVNLGIEWPSLGISVADVDNFMIWGNYNVGFGQPNGVLALQEELTGASNGFDILARNIGAGRDANLYSIGLNGEIQMGEDVSGDDGAPIFNVYSIYETPLIAEDYTHGSQYMFGDPSGVGNFSNAEGSGGGFDLGDTTDNDLAFAMNVFGDAIAANQNITDGSIPPDSIPLPGGAGDTWQPQSVGDALEQIVSYIDLFAQFMPEEKRNKALELKQKIETLESSELFAIYEELRANGFNLNKILKSQLDKAIGRITDEITSKMDSLNLKIENAILNPVDTLVGKANDLIVGVIDGVAENIIQMLGDGSITDIVTTAADATKDEITAAISQSINASIRTNVTDKITGFIDTVFTDQVNKFIAEEISRMGYAIIDGDMEDVALDSMLQNAEVLLENISQEVLGAFRSVSLSSVRSTCQSIVDDAVNGIDWNEIGENIKNKVIDAAEEVAIDAITNTITDAFGDSTLTNGLIENLTENFEFDFSNLGEKLANGDIDDIVIFDPTKIKITSKVVDLEGMVEKIEDDTWGSCWQAYLNATIKKPKEIGMYARYINGKVDDYNYWFVEVAADKGLGIPFVGGTLLDGIGGKVYKHMKYLRDENNLSQGTYLPNDSVNFGVGASLWMIDAASQGKTLKLKVGAEVVILDDAFEMSISGDVAVKSKDNAKEASMETAVISGNGFVSYSSVNNHLMGRFNVNANVSPLVCGSGELGFSVMPSSWQVYAGTKQSPITIELLCRAPLAVDSWFDIGNNYLQFGIESQFSFAAQSPWFKVGRYWRPYAGFGWHFLTELDMEFDPNVVINNAQILMHVWGELGVDWQKRNGDGDVTNEGNVTFASVELLGNVQYSQNVSESKFQGQLAGAITVLTIDISFDLNVNKTL